MSDQPPPSPPPGEPPPPPAADASLIVPRPGAIDPVVPLVVGIFLGAVAYFFYGQWQKGVAILGATIVLCIVTCGVFTAILLPVHVAIGLDAYYQAQHLKQGRSIRQWTFFNQTA
jgi:hypothetical protein